MSRKKNTKKQRRQHYRRLMKFYSIFLTAVAVALFVAYGIVSYAETTDFMDITQNLDEEDIVLVDEKVSETEADVVKYSVDTVTSAAQVIEGVEIVATEEAEVESEIEDETGEEVVAYTMWATTSLNVRSGAGTDYSIIGYYSYADEVSVIATENGWSKVQYGEKVGYVSSKFLSETELTPKKSYNGIYEGDTLSAILTYYCSCSACCGKSDGITASGCQIYDGVVACNWLPLGTVVSIDGVTYTVADRGGSSFNTVGRFDVYTSAGHQVALDMGKTYTTVVIVSLP